MKSTALFLAVITLFFVACSSDKQSGKSSGISRWYHNTTAHYNGFFYARLKMNEVESQVTASRKDNYSQLLDLFPAGNDDDQVSANDMDSVIKRLTVVVKLHPTSKWTDDSYLLIGKAYYYKKDYQSALAVFQYVSGQFKNPGVTSPVADNNNSSTSHSSTPAIHSKKPLTGAEKQKLMQEEEDKEQAKAASTPSKPPPASNSKKSMTRYEDQVWLARTLVNLEEYDQAAAVLSYLEQDQNFPSDLKGMRAAVHAFLYIDQKQYNQAIDPMKDAVAFTTDKVWKNRYMFVLGQLYEMNGDYENASASFTKVAESSNSYEMILAAKLSEARAYYKAGVGNLNQVLAMLESLAHDDKYDDYYDVIYYYMGKVNERQGKDAQAIRNFESSIHSPLGSSHQKGLSFLELGQLSFGDQDYLTAQPYYDSAVSFLDAKKMDTLDRVKKIQSVLDRLAAESNIIITEDSLQRIAAMSEADRNAFIDDLIAQMKKKEAAAARDSSDQANSNNYLNNPLLQNQNPALAANGSVNIWYFYNTVTKSTGFNDFRSRWGNRDNTDNWRRSDKSSDNSTALVAPETGATGNKNNATPGATSVRDMMLANLPLTMGKLQESNERIFDAYYSTGLIYKDELNAPDKAISTFEKLSSQYSDNKNITQVYYCLYLLYLQQGNSALASKYKDLTVQSGPQSIYAQIVTDSNFQKKKNINPAGDYYALAYNSYQNAQYDDAMFRVHTADSLFSNQPLLAKFDFLGALCTGKTQERTAFIAALDTFIAKHPSGEEHDAAVNILVALGVRQAVTNVTPNNGTVNVSQKTNDKSPYKLSTDRPQYLVIVFNSTNPEIEGVIDSIANYNSQNHSLNNYKTSKQLLDTKTEMIIVKQMKDPTEAMNYYNEIDGDDDLFDAASDLTYQMFVIDDQNFRLFMQRKNVQEYLSFFEQNYDTGDNE